MLLFVYTTTRKRFVIFTCRYFKLSWNTTALSQSNCSNFSCSSIKCIIYYYDLYVRGPPENPLRCLEASSENINYLLLLFFYILLTLYWCSFCFLVISSTDESFVWRGNQGPGSIGDDQDLSDNESQLSGSALVDSCLWVGNSFWALKSTEHCPLH